MVNKTNRRTVLSAIAALPVLSLPAFALTRDQATSLVQGMAADIVETINSGKSESAMYRDFEKLMDRYADMDVIARSSLGAAARSASSSEIRSYTNVYRTYVSHKYGARFREFIGGRIEVTGAKELSKEVLVQARAVLKGQSPISVDFRTSDRSGKARVFDVVIEGISLLATERTEVGAILDQQGGSISKLTAELKRRS